MKRLERDPLVGLPLLASGGERIGRVEAVFADYLLVRSTELVPIDLYVPRPEVREEEEAIRAGCTPREARERWHRPLKRAPHD